jgi:hypothetical protein
MMELLASSILRREVIQAIGRAVRRMATVLMVVQALVEVEILAEADLAAAGDPALSWSKRTIFLTHSIFTQEIRNGSINYCKRNEIS